MTELAPLALAPPVPAKIQVASNATWTRIGLLLKTTHRTCVCGEQHKSVELFEHWTAPGRLLGAVVGARRLVPFRETRLPSNLEIAQLIVNEPLAVCPSCLNRHRVVDPAFPPLDQQRWTETVKRKAQELAADQAALRPRPPGSRPSTKPKTEKKQVIRANSSMAEIGRWLDA